MGNEFGVSRAACLQRAADRGLADRVHVVGPQYGEERLPYLDACDAYISLSHRENFNFTAMECLASGIPLILSAGNDIAGDIAHVGCGWMIPVGGRPADAIDTACNAPRDSLPEMGATGRAWARRHLMVSRFREQVQGLARRCAEGRH
jgi:glycosyltransferase involved in cell wall biosynthesis